MSVEHSQTGADMKSKSFRSYREAARGLFKILVFMSLACASAVSGAAEEATTQEAPKAAPSPILTKCRYWINDTGVRGDLDMITGGLNQLIDPARKVRLTLYHMRSDKDQMEIEARIFGPCTEAEKAKAAQYRAGCFGHEFGRTIVTLTGPLENLPKLNFATENYSVTCEGGSK
jgi:hypothetical protein